ncbi:MAG: PIN domain-containing protein [Candidatus Schekmanbacteria bacterium]|nr:PIN domain-containing protein [Candidatus Schekmanbacteria bacterium]
MGNKSKIIADTCIWIEFFRSKSEISNQLMELIAANRIVGNGIIMAELLQGVKTNKEREIIIETFKTLDYMEIDKEVWLKAGILAAEMRSKGRTIPLSDILLACCAEKYNLQIFTVDKHFQDIPNISIFPLG